MEIKLFYKCHKSIRKLILTKIEMICFELTVQVRVHPLFLVVAAKMYPNPHLLNQKIK